MKNNYRDSYSYKKVEGGKFRETKGLLKKET